MNLRKTLTVALVLLTLPLCTAHAFKTKGDGTTYTLAQLAQIAAAGISVQQDNNPQTTYLLTENDTIAQGDRFVMDDNVTMAFGDGMTFVVEGEADFRLTQGSVFTAAADIPNATATAYGIYVSNEVSQTPFVHCTFKHVGLRCASTKGMTLEHCAFYNHNGVLGQAALTLGTDEAPFTISNCHFEHAAKAAIAGAANYRNPLLIEDCTFFQNGTANGNTPQLNLTVADSVVVRRCTIEGAPEHTMVGAVVVANLVNFTDKEYITRIEDNIISHNRFGISTYVRQKAYITGNTLTDNCHETNPMNGGSGINVYDPYNVQYTYISRNHIEGSLWGITLVGGKEANIGRTDISPSDPNYNPGGNTFLNNGFDGQLYDLYNNSKNTVYAQGNTWNVTEQTQEQIEAVIFHKADNASLGEVIYMPAAENASITMPRSDSNTLFHHQLFTLGGQRVNAQQPFRHGIYLEHGRKVVR